MATTDDIPSANSANQDRGNRSFDDADISSQDLRQNEMVYNKIMGDIRNIESNLSEINTKISSLTAKRNTLYEQANKLQQDLQAKSDEISQLQDRIQSDESKLNALTSERDQLKAESEKLKNEGSASSERVKGLAQKIMDRDLQIASLQKEKNELQSKRDQLEKSSENDLKNLDTLAKKIQDINVKISDNNQRLGEILQKESWNLENKTVEAPEAASVGTQTEIPVPEELQEQEEKEIQQEAEEFDTPDFIKNMTDNEDDDEQEGGKRRKRRKQKGGSPRLPLMYGGTKLPKWRIKKSATSLFRGKTRAQMNRLATKWGVCAPMKYKRKKDLAIAMKLLMHYRFGDLKTRDQINRIGKIVGLKKSYKTKAALKRAINKKMGGLKMRGGSFFAAELKRGLLNRIKTPLLTGGQGRFLIKGGRAQGNFLTMRKSSYLKGGSADKIQSLQKKRKELEKKLDQARKNKASRRDKDKIQTEISGVDRAIKRIIGGGCGCMAGKKYRAGRGGSAPLDYAMKASYFHDQPRSGNHSGGGLVGMTQAHKNLIAPALGAAAGVALVGGKRKRKSKRKPRKSSKSRRKSKRSRRKSSKKKR